MLTFSYQEQRQVQEKLQAEADRERVLESLKQQGPRKGRGLWKMIASLVF